MGYLLILLFTCYRRPHKIAFRNNSNHNDNIIKHENSTIVMNSSQSLLEKVSYLLDQCSSSLKNHDQNPHLETMLQERYLTCCSCLLLSLSQIQQQQQQQDHHQQDQQQKNGCRNVIRNLVFKYPLLKKFIHEFLMIPSSSSSSSSTTTRTQQQDVLKVIKRDEQLQSCYQRMGIQLLSYYYILPNTTNDIATTRNNININSNSNGNGNGNQNNIMIWNEHEWRHDFDTSHELLRTIINNNDKSCPNSHLIVIIEMMQLISLLLQNFIVSMTTTTMSKSDTEMDNWIEVNIKKIYKMPQLIFESYHHHHYNSYQQEKSRDEQYHKDHNAAAIDQNNIDNNDKNNDGQIMIEILSTIINKHNNVIMNCINDETDISLSSSPSSSNHMKKFNIHIDQSQFELVFVQFISHYLQFINMLLHSYQHSLMSNINDSNVSILSRSILLNMIQRLTTTISSSPSTKNIDHDDDSSGDGGNNNNNKLTSMPSTVNLLLNLSLLSLMDVDIRKQAMYLNQNNNTIQRNWTMVQSLSPSSKKRILSSTSTSTTSSTSIDIQLAISIQKLILFNLSSKLDYSTKSYTMLNDKNNECNMMKIRSMTLGLFSTLMEECGVDWIFSMSSSISTSKDTADKKTLINKQFTSSSQQLGESSFICSCLRLIAGELRLSMGTFLDVRYKEGKEEDTNGTSSIPISTESHIDEELNNLFLEKVTHCIEIGCYILQILMEMRDDFTIDTSSNWKLNPDAILHMKHSLDDMLDSTIQFLLQDNFRNDWVWQQGAFQCCRFFGCYLADVDIFEYDDGSDNIIEEECNSPSLSGDDVTSGYYPPDMPQTKMSSHHLFMALRNGLHLLHDLYTGVNFSNTLDTTISSTDRFSVVTLFPCVSTILSSCFYDSNITKRQVQMAKRYLLNNICDEKDVLVTLLCTVMRKTLAQVEDYDNTCYYDEPDTNNSFLLISWCNKVIESLFRFMIRSTTIQTSSSLSSSNDHHPVFFSSQDEKRVQTLHYSMYPWIKDSMNLSTELPIHQEMTEIGKAMVLNLMLVIKFVSAPLAEKLKKETEMLELKFDYDMFE